MRPTRLAIAWSAVALFAACSDRPDQPGPPAAAAWLVDVTAESGVDFLHESGAAGAWAMPEIMGGGAALFDHDGDGDLDIYLTNGQRESGPAAVNRLFSNQGNLTFEDVTAASGLGDGGYGMGVAVGDVDNDGDLDVYVANVGADRLYRNRGDGVFDDVTAAAGIAVDGWSSSATFFDYDGDGWLDLFVARYVRHEPGKRCPDSAGRPNYCGPDSFEPEADVLLRNLGGGRYRDVSAEAGIAAARGAGLGVVAADLDADGRIDIYVTNDGGANRLWINRGDGTFRDDALLFGVALDMHGRAEAGMGVVAADLDGDLAIDLFMTHLANETNTWYRNRGPGRGFEDVSEGDLGPGSLPDTGFGTAAIDLESDGDLDIVVANGRVSRTDPRPGVTVGSPWDLFAEPNRVFIDRGAGDFAAAGPEAREFSGPVEVSRALAAGDLDSDGDLDLVVANLGSPARIYRNDSPRQGHWLAVRTFDPRLGRDVPGTRVVAVSGQGTGGRRLVRLAQPGSGYLTSGDPRAWFGLGDLAPTHLEVHWPDGLVERFAVPGVDREIRIDRGAGEAPR